jgi:hypothetical protein
MECPLVTGGGVAAPGITWRPTGYDASRMRLAVCRPSPELA